MVDAQKFEIRRNKNGISFIVAKEFQTKELQILLAGSKNIRNGVRVVFSFRIAP